VEENGWSNRPFRYPTVHRCRRHGPAGYKDFGDYRPWLEDEFSFRCVYCLKRQQWAPTDIWSVDHLVPQSEDPARECDYANLVLACQWCNNKKLANSVPDPVAVPYGNCLLVNYATGRVETVNDDGIILERVLKLNHPKQVRMRQNFISWLAILARSAPDEWKRLMGFPKELPNLRQKIPPAGNSRLEGLDECFYEQQKNDRLPEVYE
jgi:hypothetical protein